MTTSVTKRALEGLGIAVSENYADGVLQAGERVIINNSQWTLSSYDVSSNIAFDTFLEGRLGGKIDIFDSSWGGLQNLVWRHSAMGVRIVDAAGTDQAPDNPYFRVRPSYSDLSARYQAQVAACGYWDTYCSTSLASQYGQLSSSLTYYASTYDSFRTTYLNFLGRSAITAYDVQAYLSAERSAAASLAPYYQFYGMPLPTPIPVPTYPVPYPDPYYDPIPSPWPDPYYPPSYPKNPDNDDWSVPSYPPSYPRNPDNDDWGSPSYPPSYPETPGDWGGGSQEDKDW